MTDKQILNNEIDNLLNQMEISKDLKNCLVWCKTQRASKSVYKLVHFGCRKILKRESTNPKSELTLLYLIDFTNKRF